MPKCSTAQDSVNFEEYTTENDVKLINHETIISDCIVGSNSISAENSPGFNPPKNGLIASALEIPNSVCLSFEHVDPQMDCTSDSLKIDEEVVQDVKRLDLSDKQPKDLCTDQQLESVKSEDSRHNETLQDDELKYDLISPKKFNEVIIDGFAILSFKTKEDMLEFTKLSESQSSGTDPLLEQTYKRARRCGIPKRKRTKGFLKQTLSPTSTSTDLLRHYHHRHYNRHNHHSSKKQHHHQQQEEHPDHHPIYSYNNTHYENNHLPGSVHLTPKNNTSIKHRINNNNNNNDNTVAGITTMATTTTEINTNNTTNYSHLSPIYPCNNSLISNNNNNNNNNNTSNHHHHHSRHNNYSNEIMNNINSSEKLDHSAVQCMNESLPNYSPYYFTTITSVSSMPSLPNSSVSTASPLSPQSMTLYNKTNQNRSNNNNNSNSNNNGVDDDNDRSIQLTEYSSMNSLNHHSDMVMNITSSSSSPGVWNSQIKMECVPPQKIDKTTYAKLCDIDGVKPLLTNPLSDNCKRTESNSSSNNSNNNNNNNNKPHHLFSVAALTDEVMHHSPHSTSDDYKPQLTNIKSPKPSQTNSNNNNKKRMYRRSEQSDTPSSAYDNYDKSSSSITHSQRECATYTDRCTTITTDNKNNETPKSGMMMNLTSRNNNNNNNNIDRIYDNMSKYSSLPLSSACSVASSSSSPSLSSSGHHVVSSNQNFNMNKMMSSGQRNSSIDVSSSASHAHKLSRAGSGEGMLNSMQHNLQFNQFKPMSSVVQSTPTKPSSSSSVSSTSSLSTNISSNPSLLPHQNLLKQFMGIDSQTANQLFNDPRFMELYALTMATLNGSTGGRGVDGKESLSSSHRIPLVNLENTASNPINNISQNNNNNNSNNNNASNQIRNGCINEYSRSDPSLLLTETMSSHFGHVNSSGFQNKLYPYNNSSNSINNNNNSTTGAPPRVPPLSGTNCSTSCTSVNCSPSIKRPPSNSERFSPGNPQTARSQAAVLAAAYADREFLSSHNNNTNSNSTLGKSKSSSSAAACTSLPSNRHNNSNTSVHNYSMPNNSSNSSVHPIQRISNFTSMAHSTGSAESVYNSKSNPVNFHHHNHPPPHQHQHPPSSSSSTTTTNSPMLLSSSTRSSSESMMTDRNFSSHPLKLPNGDPYNTSLPSLSLDDRNLIGVHKSEHIPPPPQPPESSAHRSSLPLPMMPPFPSPQHIPPEFLKQFFNTESFLFPGSKMNSSSTNLTNMTSSSSASSVLSPSSLPSSSCSQQFQSPLLQSMYFPTRGGGNQPNRTVDKISHTGILHRPVRGDKPYGRWADAHIRIALFIQYCESMQRPQPSSSMPPMFPTCRLPIRPIPRRLNPGVHSSVSSSISGQAVQCNPTRLQQHSESGTNRSVNMPPPLIPAPVSQPPRSANNNDNSIPPDASLFWRHLFNEFMSSLSKEFVNNLPDCKDTQMAMLQNFFSHMSQFTSALGGPSSSSSNSTSKLPFSTSTVTPSLSSSLATCLPVTIGSSIGNYSFPLMTQSSNLLRTSPSTCSSSSSTSGVRPSLPPSGGGVGGVSAPVNFNLPTGLLNPEIKRRRTDSFGMDTTNHPGIPPFPPPMRMPPFPRPSNPSVPGVLSHHPPPAPPHHHHQDRHQYPPHQHHQSHTHQQHHHQQQQQQQQLPVHGAPPPSHPFPGHSDVINNATANFLNGFRLPDTLLNRLPQPPPPQPQPQPSLHPQHNTGSTSLSNSNTTMNESFPSNDKNSRSSNTTNTASHLVPINPW